MAKKDTAAAPAKKRVGRPSKPEAERLEQFSVRLPPKLKFGLELLARLQGGRSLSQVVEWAIQVGLRNAVLTDSRRRPADHGDRLDPETVGDLVDALWAIDGSKQRLVTLWKRAPALVDFEDRSLCEYVYNSKEMTPNMMEVWRDARPGSEARLDTNGWWRFSSDFHDCLWAFLEKHWDKLKLPAHQMQLAGRSLRGQTIEELVRRQSSDLENEMFETVRPAIEKWLP